MISRSMAHKVALLMSNIKAKQPTQSMFSDDLSYLPSYERPTSHMVAYGNPGHFRHTALLFQENRSHVSLSLYFHLVTNAQVLKQLPEL